MKKIIICAAVVLAAGLLTSCNKDTNRCWEITVELSGAGSATFYVWGTQNELDTEIALIEQEAKEEGAKIKIDYKRTHKAESECESFGDIF